MALYSVVAPKNIIHHYTAIKDSTYQYQSIFPRFKSMWEKQIIARATGIQK